jgi:hypothetical protein
MQLIVGVKYRVIKKEVSMINSQYRLKLIISIIDVTYTAGYKISESFLWVIQTIGMSPTSHTADVDSKFHFYPHLCPCVVHPAAALQLRNICWQWWHKQGILHTAQQNGIHKLLGAATLVASRTKRQCPFLCRGHLHNTCARDGTNFREWLK